MQQSITDGLGLFTLVIGVGLRLLKIKHVRLVSFLPALLLAPVFVAVADALTALSAQ